MADNSTPVGLRAWDLKGLIEGLGYLRFRVYKAWAFVWGLEGLGVNGLCNGLVRVLLSLQGFLLVRVIMQAFF